MIKFIIKENVPSKKNSKEISVRNGRPFVRCSKRYMEWNEYAVMSLRVQARGKKFSQCKVMIDFYYGDKRKRDIDNGVASVFDTLKDAGIIEDDNYTLISKCHVRGFYDKNNPRCEITILNLDEYVDVKF